MAADHFVDRQWTALLRKLQSFPLDWRQDEVNARRLDALGKEVRLSDLYAACPSLRKRVASHGGLGKLWIASHSWRIDHDVSQDEQLPRAVHQTSDTNQEAMWLQLLADLQKYPLSWNAHLHKDLKGALLGRQLHLAQRFARCPALRRRLDQEGGLCNLWEKVHHRPSEGTAPAKPLAEPPNWDSVTGSVTSVGRAGYDASPGYASAGLGLNPLFGHWMESSPMSSENRQWALLPQNIPPTRLQQQFPAAPASSQQPYEPGFVKGDGLGHKGASSSSAVPKMTASMRWLGETQMEWRL